VGDERARAIRHESAAALGDVWGVSRSTAQRGREAFGVGRRGDKGSPSITSTDAANNLRCSANLTVHPAAAANVTGSAGSSQSATVGTALARAVGVGSKGSNNLAKRCETLYFMQ
jgi:hypothetical protein